MKSADGSVCKQTHVFEKHETILWASAKFVWEPWKDKKKVWAQRVTAPTHIRPMSLFFFHAKHRVKENRKCCEWEPAMEIKWKNINGALSLRYLRCFYSCQKIFFRLPMISPEHDQHVLDSIFNTLFSLVHAWTPDFFRAKFNVCRLVRRKNLRQHWPSYPPLRFFTF